MILGLTGSLGSGKSSVASALQELGAVVLEADEVARDAILPGQPAHAEILREFGPEIVSADGTINRQKLASVVFSDPGRRRKLEAIIHPRVRAAEEEFIDKHRDAGLVVLDIPLLYETGAEQLCDRVAVVTVGEEERFQRLHASRGMSREEIGRRLAAQMPQDEKIQRADHLIDNSGTWERTLQQVKVLYRELTSQ